MGCRVQVEELTVEARILLKWKNPKENSYRLVAWEWEDKDVLN